MSELTRFQEEAVLEFRKKLIEIFSAEERKGVVNDKQGIKKTLEYLSGIGRYLIVDYTPSASLDRFSAVYKFEDILSLAWYESIGPKSDGTNWYLRFNPEKMVVNIDDDPRWCHLVIQTKPIPELPKSSFISVPDVYGLQKIVDRTGSYVRHLQKGEREHTLMVMCDPGRVVIHPKGSVLTDKYRSHYFTNIKQRKAK